MSFDERLGWLILGGLVGFVLGYIVRHLQEIKEEVDEVKEVVTNHKNEDGLTRHPVVLDVVLFIVVLTTAWAAFQTAKVNDRLQHTVNCITQYNTYQGKAVAHRDAAIEAGTRSEIRLWTRYGELYEQAKKDPSKMGEAQEALRKAIKSHRDSLVEIEERRDAFPYAHPNILTNCQDEE